MEQNRNKEKAIPDPDRGNKDSTTMPKERTGESLQSGIIVPANKELDLDEVVKEANVAIGPPPEKQEESTPERDPELESPLKELDEVPGNVPKKQEEVAGSILPKTDETDIKTEAALPQKIDEEDQAITEPEESPKIGKEEQQAPAAEDAGTTEVAQQTQDDKNQENDNFQELRAGGVIESPSRQTQTGPTKNVRLGVMSRGNTRFLAAEVYDSSGQKRYYRVERRGRRVVYRTINSRAMEERNKGVGGFRFEAFSNTNQQTNSPTQPVKSRTGGQAAKLQANVQVSGEDATGTNAESSQSLAASSSIRSGQDSGSGTGTMQVKIAPGSKFRIDLENNTIEAI